MTIGKSYCVLEAHKKHSASFSQQDIPAVYEDR